MPLTDEELGESPFQLAIAREVPGFGGVFYEPGQGRLVVAHTEEGRAHLPRAQELVRAVMGPEAESPLAAAAPVEFGTRVFEYTFLELAEHRARLRPRLFAIEGVVALEVDEEFNRIRVGVMDTAVIAVVEDVATELSVPSGALSFWEAVPAETSHSEERTETTAASRTLRSRVPDGRLQGGYQIFNSRGGACTLGFTALRWGSNSALEQFAFTNSHCTKEGFKLDDGKWGQPGKWDIVGAEAVDPGTHSCWVWNNWLWPITKFWPRCRHSDAALMTVDSALMGEKKFRIDLGKIGRTIEKSNCESCYPSLKIDSLNPTITITSTHDAVVDNEILHKIGRTTGWTYGAVESTCVDWLLASDWVVRECSDRVDYQSDDGDSGSPVFAYNEKKGTAQLRGIHFASIPVPFFKDALMSNLHQIEKDIPEIADMWLYLPGPPSVGIQGPKAVPEGVACIWKAKPRGMSPFTIAWTGVLERSGRVAKGVVKESGDLIVTVTDLIGRVAVATLPVTVSKRISECPKWTPLNDSVPRIR